MVIMVNVIYVVYCMYIFYILGPYRQQKTVHGIVGYTVTENLNTYILYTYVIGKY